MNKNPFLPQPSYTPQQPPLPPGPPPPQPAQPDYTAYWAAAAAHQQQHAHIQPPTVGVYNPQWSTPQVSRPPPEQSALYANYGYGTQQNNHWQRQQQQQQQQHQPYHPPPAPIVQPPPAAQPGYNPYQPTAGYPQQYVPQTAPPPQPIAQPAYPHPPPQHQQQYFPQHHILPQQQQQQQQQQQPRHLHHPSPQHLPPAKRQRFDGPNSNRHNQNIHHPPPPQPQFQPPPAPVQVMGPYPGPTHGPGRGGPPGGIHPPMGTGRGGPTGGRGGISAGARGGRGGSMTNTRGGMSARGRGSGFIGASGGGSGGGRGGGGGGPAASLRGHGSRGNFGGGGNHGRRGGGSFTSGGGGGGYSHQNSSSFRSRGQGHSGPNRGPRHDGGSSASFGARDGSLSSNFNNSGKKDENRRTLTDFKIIGLEIQDLSWTWGTFPTAPAVIDQVKEEADHSEALQIPVKDEVMEDEDVLKMGSSSEVEGALLPNTHNDDAVGIAETATPVIGPKAPHEDATPTESRAHVDSNPNAPPPSRIRIYFHTPVTADDSRPIPHNSSSSTFSFGLTPSDSRKGKRKKLEDDDGDIEEGRAPPPPPRMASGMGDDRSSVAASVAPSVAESVSEADWLMAAIVEGEEAETEAELDPEREEQEDDVERNVTQIVEQHEKHDLSNAGSDENGNGIIAAADMTGTADRRASMSVIETGDETGTAGARDAEASQSSVVEPEIADVPAVEVEIPGLTVVVPATDSEEGEGEELAPSGDLPASPDAALHAESSSVSSSQHDPSPPVEEQTADFLGLPETQILDAPPEALKHQRPLLEVSLQPTMLNIEAQDAEASEDGGATIVNGDIEQNSEGETTQELHADTEALEHLPEPPASPVSNTLLSTSSTSTYGDSPTQPAVKSEDKTGRTPSANRLSISYAGGNRRLVIDAEVVESLKVFRQEGRIEVLINIGKEDDGCLKGILMEGLSEVTKSYLPVPTSPHSSESDNTLPPFSKLATPSSIKLLVHLDTARPLSEPKWAKSGDVQDWLKSMFGRMFWVAGDAAEGWEKKIQVVDPDPPPTIWTVLDGWAVNSPVGALNERQRFLRTHMTETDNILEILLRLVRGERATPFSQSSPAISAPSVSGPLLSALSQSSAHGSQQTHVSLAVLAMFRMAVDYAVMALENKGKIEVDERTGEIIRCLPSHLIYKSLDGIFKEWRVDKKGR